MTVGTLALRSTISFSTKNTIGYLPPYLLPGSPETNRGGASVPAVTNRNNASLRVANKGTGAGAPPINSTNRIQPPDITRFNLPPRRYTLPVRNQ